MLDAIGPRTKTAVDSFQRYILAESVRRASRWRFAKDLIQQVGEDAAIEIGERPPVDPTRLARALNVEMRSSVSPNGVRGSLELSGNRFILNVWGGQEARDWRFTVAHEIAHLLFYYRGHAIARILPKRDSTSRGAEREEGLCDDFARAFLLPRDWVSAIAKQKPSAKFLLTEARRAAVLPGVLIFRLLHDLKVWPDAAFYFLSTNGTDATAYRGVARKRGKAPTRGAILAAVEVLRGQGIPNLVVPEHLTKPGLVLANADFASTSGGTWFYLPPNRER